MGIKLGEYENIHLVEVEGELCLCYFLRRASHVVINAWILADITNKHWVKRYEINVDSKFDGYFVEPLGIYSDDLLHHRKDRGLFSHNLLQGTTRKFGINGQYVESSQKTLSAISYKMSLVSLKLCLKVLKGKPVKGRKWKEERKKRFSFPAKVAFKIKNKIN